MNNDTWTAFAIVRQLSGKSPNIEKSVLMENGKLVSDETMRKERWQRHFSHVFNGEVTEYDVLTD